MNQRHFTNLYVNQVTHMYIPRRSVCTAPRVNRDAIAEAQIAARPLIHLLEKTAISYNNEIDSATRSYSH